MAKKLYVANLAYEVTDSDLNQLFAQCGQVGSAEVIIDPASGHSKGFGFVEMPNDDEAKHAVSRMNGYDLKGRQLSVEFAKDKPEGAVRAARDFDRAPRGGNGGGGGGGGGRAGGNRPGGGGNRGGSGGRGGGSGRGGSRR